MRSDAPTRPAWAARLDGLSLVAARLLGRLLRRPQDSALEDLARADRGEKPPQPTMAIASIDQARRAFAEGRHGEALHLFGEILAADPDSAWAWHGRGDALHLLGQHDDALDAYTRAAELAPKQGLHQGGRANALRTLGRAAEADAAWTAALALDPGLTWMRDGRGPPG